MKCLNIILLMCGCSLTAADLKVIIRPLSSSIQVRENMDFNLTCLVFDSGNDNKVFNISWILPNHKITRSRVQLHRAQNSLVLSIYKFQRVDAGAYICEARHGDVEESQIINVKEGKEKCPNQLFDCGMLICIPYRYLCDGFQDCPDGSDESVEHCGYNKCEGKYICEGRCIEKHLCCDRRVDTNCTAAYVFPCCYRYLNDGMPVNILETDSSDPPVTFKYHNLGFYQSTIYTMISCAVGFIFMSTVMLIAVCRIRMRRNAWLMQSNRRAGQRWFEQHCAVLQQQGNNQSNEERLPSNHNFPNRSDVTDPMENFVLLTYDNNTGFEVAEYGPKPPPYAESSIGIPPPPYSSTVDISVEPPLETQQNNNAPPSTNRDQVD